MLVVPFLLHDTFDFFPSILLGLGCTIYVLSPQYRPIFPTNERELTPEMK